MRVQGGFGDANNVGQLHVAVPDLLGCMHACMQVVNAFDKEFQEQSDEIIFQTILAANFLDIKNLLELMCKKVSPHCTISMMVADAHMLPA